MINVDKFLYYEYSSPKILGVVSSCLSVAASMTPKHLSKTCRTHPSKIAAFTSPAILFHVSISAFQAQYEEGGDGAGSGTRRNRCLV